MKPIVVALLGMFCVCAASFAADPPPAQQPGVIRGPIVGVGRGTPLTPEQDAAERAARAQEWIKVFAGDDADSRPVAAEQLARLGADALPAVEKAASAADLSPEVKARFDVLLAALRADGKARPALDKYLKAAGAAGGDAGPVVDDALRQAFADVTFYVLRFRQFPVAHAVPEGMKASNVLAVAADGAVTPLADVDALTKFFRAALPPVKDEAAAKRAVRAWLRVSQEWRQDGFYRFATPEESLAVEKTPAGMTAAGKASVTGGGNRGEVTAKLTFDADGKLASAADAGQVREGVRPICQATKLLDPDPIVRGMAEQAIRVIGPAAADYLAEQRAKADPELRAAIDAARARVMAESQR